MNNNNEKVFSYPLDKLEELLDLGHEQLMTTEELLLYILEKETFNPWLFSTLCDMHSANYKLTSEVEGIIEDNYIDKESEDESAWKVTMSREDTVILETIMIARYYTEKELLEKGNLSISIH